MAAVFCLSSHAMADESKLSPIDFLLSEAGISEATISKNGKRDHTPHLGYEAVSLTSENRSRIKIHGKNVKKKKDIDNISLDLGQDKARCMELESKLTSQYGPPVSKRNNIRIWEIKNSDMALGQAKKTTIMAGEENGKYFVSIDRKGPKAGNNPRTNRALRQKANKRSRRQVSKKAAPQIDMSIRD